MNQAEQQVSISSPGHIAVSAPMTFQTARHLCAAGIECFKRDGSPMMVVDCAAVTRADSAGLAVLIEWRRWAHQVGHHLMFANLPVQISAIAHLSEVSAVLADAVA